MKRKRKCCQKDHQHNCQAAATTQKNTPEEDREEAEKAASQGRTTSSEKTDNSTELNRKQDTTEDKASTVRASEQTAPTARMAVSSPLLPDWPPYINSRHTSREETFVWCPARKRFIVCCPGPDECVARRCLLGGRLDHDEEPAPLSNDTCTTQSK